MGLGQQVGPEKMGQHGGIRRVDLGTNLPVAALSAPDRSTVGEMLTVDVVVQTPSGCHSFERVEADEEPGRLVLRAIGRYTGRADVQCGASIGEIAATYTHVPAALGALVITAKGYDRVVEAEVFIEQVVPRRSQSH